MAPTISCSRREWRQRVAEIKEPCSRSTEVQAWLGAIWDELRRIVLDDLAAPHSRTRAALAAGLASLGRTLAADPAMQQRLHAGIEHAALAVVPWRGQIGALIAEVVRGWDAAPWPRGSSSRSAATCNISA